MVAPMRARALLAAVLLLAPGAALGAPAAAAQPVPGLASQAAVSPGETSAAQIFNDSLGPPVAGVAPGAPAVPLLRTEAAGAPVHIDSINSTIGGAQPSSQVLGFAQTGEVISGDWQQDLDFPLLSTIAYDSLDIQSDGTITDDAGYQGWWSGQMTDLMTTAHAAGDRVVMVITDFSSSSIESVISNPTYTQNAITAVVQQLEQRGGDGVNVDFEGLTPAVSPAQFTSFIAQLRAALQSRVPQQSYLTVDTYGSSYLSGATMMDISGLRPYVDAFDLMEYDITDPCSSTAGPNAPMNGYPYSVTQVVDGYLTLVPAKQILLGVPYYGYKWSVSQITPEAPTAGCAEADTYSDMLNDLACVQQLTVNWDPEFEEPWATWYSPPTADPCGGDWGSWREMYYDDAQSLAAKYQLVTSLGLGGIGIWALGYDAGSDDLWNTIAGNLVVSHGGAIADSYTVPSSRYQALTPFRILDTRAGSCVNCGGGALGPGGSVSLTVAGYQDPGTGQAIPATGVTAVVLNLTAVQGTAGTYLSVTPAGGSAPATSSVNAGAGQVVANLVIAPLGTGGAIDITNAAGTVNVVADVVGYFTSTPGGAGLYHTLSSAVRVCDSRAGQGTACSTGAGSPLVAGHPQLVHVVDGTTGVSTGGAAAAVVLNLTAVAPSASTYLEVYPPSPSTHTCGAPPTISNLNPARGVVEANRVITAVDPTDGSVCVANAAGTVNFVMDVNGWFGDGGDAGGLWFHTAGPARICDTRPSGSGPAPPCAGETLAPGSSLAVQVGGEGGLPSGGIQALAANLTAVSGTAGTYLRARPDGVPASTSDLNVAAGQTQANLMMVTVTPDQEIDIDNAQGDINAVIDIEGWFG
jgi:hypothetical protein